MKFKFNSKKTTTTLPDPALEKRVKAELEKMSVKYAVITSYFSITLVPLWGILIYFFIEEGFSTIFLIQIAHSIFTILLVYLTIKLDWKSWPLNYTLAIVPVEIAYYCNIVQPDSLSFCYIGYSGAFIVGGLFVIWKPFFTSLVWSLTSIVYLIFHYTISTHIMADLIRTGGLFFFCMSIVSIFYSMVRYNKTKNDIKSGIIISKANERLKELDKAKTNFIANISHEFRTPLTLILGPLEVMMKDLSQKNSIDVKKGDLQSMHRNSVMLLKLVNNLLDFSRIEADKMKPEFSKTNITGRLKNYISTLESAASAKNITINTTIDNDKIFLYIDRGMFEKIIMNLLSNAYKFTDEGGEININAWEEEKVYIRISDTGCGIPEDKISSIFDRFSQVDSSTKRRHEGTGIGLSLAKELINIHKGEISVKSEFGKGTVFTMSFNQGMEHLEKDLITDSIEEDEWGEIGKYLAEEISVPDTEHLEQPGNGKGRIECEPNHGIKILIVEDNEDMLQFIASILREKCEVHTAFNGVEGLRKVKEICPNLVLSDVMMPKMDGYELVEQIRKDKECSTIPIILLTAKADIPDKLRGFRKGANDYIAKPFNTDELCARIKSQLKLAELRVKVNGKHEKYKEKKKTITEITRMKIDNVIEYISQNYKDDLSRESLAEIVDISPDHLSRTFLQYTGEKLNNMINRLRVEYAAEQMLGSDQKIIEIAFDAGFNDLSTFNRIFQKIKSIPPSEYRKTEQTL